jgi:hypothetical protein
MPLTPEQIDAGRAVQRQLGRCHDAHPNSLALHRLHRTLAALRDAFRNDLTDDQFVAFGGGTNKDDGPPAP